jgi:hypothetical protein
MRELVVKFNPSCIVDLSILNTNSNYYKPNSVYQISSGIVDNNYKNYKNINRIDNYIEVDKSLIHKTKYFINDTITIINPYTNNNNDNNNNTIISEEIVRSELKNNSRTLFGSESIYISLLLSSEFNIPNVTLGIIEDNENEDKRTTAIGTADKIFNCFINLF